MYNLITLASGAIGFSVFSTTGIGFSLSQIPLGIAVVLWSLCIAYGLLFTDIASDLSISFAENLHLLSIPSTSNEEKKAKAEEFISIEKEANNLSMWQRIFFSAGIGCFKVWHILEMSQVK